MRIRNSLRAFLSFAVVVLFSSALPLAAQDLSVLVGCSKIDDSLERLRCYDAAMEWVGQAAETELYSVDDMDPAAVSRAVECPLRLELSFARDDVERKGGWTTGRTGALRCEDASIPSIRIQASAERGAVEIRLTPYVRVEPSWDRLVDLELAVVGTEGHSHPARLGGVDAEEGRTVSETTSLRLDEAVYEALFDDAGRARLQITMRVRDNR